MPIPISMINTQDILACTCDCIYIYIYILAYTCGMGMSKIGCEMQFPYSIALLHTLPAAMIVTSVILVVPATSLIYFTGGMCRRGMTTCTDSAK